MKKIPCWIVEGKHHVIRRKQRASQELEHRPRFQPNDIQKTTCFLKGEESKKREANTSRITFHSITMAGRVSVAHPWKSLSASTASRNRFATSTMNLTGSGITTRVKHGECYSVIIRLYSRDGSVEYDPSSD